MRGRLREDVGGVAVLAVDERFRLGVAVGGDKAPAVEWGLERRCRRLSA